jgi:hypothetical protein
VSWRKKKPGTYLPYVATTLNNLGTIDSAETRMEAARKEYDEALKIYRLLAQKNPESGSGRWFHPDLPVPLKGPPLHHRQ